MVIQPKNSWGLIAGADDFNAAAKLYRWPALCDPTCKFFYAKHHDVLALWRSLAGIEGIPFRAEMTARRFQPYLKSIFLYERVEPSHGERRYRMRLMGSRIVQVFGEFTGKYLDEVVPENFLPRWEALPDAVLGTGAPLRFSSAATRSTKRIWLRNIFVRPCAPTTAKCGSLVLLGITTARCAGLSCMQRNASALASSRPLLFNPYIRCGYKRQHAGLVRARALPFAAA